MLSVMLVFYFITNLHNVSIFFCLLKSVFHCKLPMVVKTLNFKHFYPFYDNFVIEIKGKLLHQVGSLYVLRSEII